MVGNGILYIGTDIMIEFRNTLAKGMAKFFRFFADTFFAKRYGKGCSKNFGGGRK